MPLTLEQYATYLDNQNMPWPAPPTVEPSKAKPHVFRMPQLKAITWNIYGTLLAIPGGELYFDHPQKFIMEVALEKTIQEFKMWGSMTRKPGQPYEYMKQMYGNVLHEMSSAPGGMHKLPEIPADRLWENILKKLLQKDYKFDASFFGSLNEYSAKVAYFFHASLQGTVCYPDAVDALRSVTRKSVSQCLLGDAQCFTMLQLQRGLAKLDAKADLGQLCDPKLNALSYQIGYRKPSEPLFRHVLDALKQKGIGPEQVLHVGSRIEKDIVPARRLGMKTALFAGDAASLQATPDQLKTPASRPDLLLTELSQIAEVLPL